MKFIRDLSKVLKQYTPEETILVVSSLDEGRRILKECAKEGDLLVGVRALTPFAIAEELCGDVLNCIGAPKLLQNGEDKDVLYKCLKSMPEEGFFKLDHAYDRKTSELMLDTINELEINKIGEIAGNDRLVAVEKLRKNYRDQKKRLNVFDRNDLLIKGIELAKESDVYKDSHFVVIGSNIFTSFEKCLLKSCQNASYEEVVMHYPKDTTVPKGIVLDKCVVNNASGQTDLDRNKMNFYRCRSTETEQRFIMRDIMSKNLNVEDCAVVFLTSDYAKGLREAASFYHIPTTISGGVPFTESVIYHLFKGVRDWANSNYNAEILYELVVNDALYIEHGYKFCKWLRDVNVGWGKDRYIQLLNRELERPELTDENRDMYLNWTKTITTLLLSVDNMSSLSEQKTSLYKLLYKKNVSEPSAYGIAKRILNSITYLDEDENCLDRLLDAMEDARYLSKHEESGKLFCVGLKKAFCTGRKHLYICGMSRFSMQGGKAESPLILDAEKKELGLNTSIDREIENNFRLKLLLLEHDGDITISYNDFDSEKMIELQPAPLLRELIGDKEIKEISYVPEDEPLTVGEIISQGKQVDMLEDNLEDISSDIEAAELKPAKSYTDQFKNRSLSPSSLETALSCPLKFYLQKILGLNPPQISESTDDSWLDAAEMGTLCHKVLERFYDEKSANFETILDQEIENLKLERPLARESAILKDRRKASRMIEDAIKWTADHNHKVVATEKGFGYNAEKEEDKKPLEITLGDRVIKLSGSIDRLDELEDGRMAVLDYKTGKSDSYKENIAKKLQPFLYTLAAEKLYQDKNVKVNEAGYLFLRGFADYLPANQTAEERKIKERTILDLLNWMEDEKQAQVPCPAFVIGEDGAIHGTGDAESAESAYKECSRYCDFKDFCDSIRLTVKESEEEE